MHTAFWILVLHSFFFANFIHRCSLPVHLAQFFFGYGYLNLLYVVVCLQPTVPVQCSTVHCSIVLLFNRCGFSMRSFGNTFATLACLKVQCLVCCCIEGVVVLKDVEGSCCVDVLCWSVGTVPANRMGPYHQQTCRGQMANKLQGVARASKMRG